MRLAGKVALITGAGSGIGRATAIEFAQEGARVVAGDIDQAAAEETARVVPGMTAMGVDVTLAPSVRGAIATVVETHGRIDILVNNVGVGLAGRVDQTEESDWDRIMAVNLKGVFLGCKFAIPYMRQQGGGVIVNTASTVGLVGVPERAAYCASKGGVIALTRAMALDHVGEGIRVNCVAPGAIDTPLVRAYMTRHPDPEGLWKELVSRHPMGRLGTPEEIARAILYLASDESSFVTGSVLIVDGGWTAR